MAPSATRKPIKNLPQETYVKLDDNPHDLYLRIAAKSRFPINRLRITKASDGGAIPNARNVTVEDVGLFEQSTVFVKDLGPQIAWRTVFLIEYLGPILIHPLIFGLRQTIYRNPDRAAEFPPPTRSAQLSLAFILLHFIKRELETLYVHRFSAATMPLFNIFKNSAHYWLLAGLNIALFTYSPAAYSPTSHEAPDWWLALAATLFTVGELGNLSAHLTLKNLRTEGGKERGIPSGGFFSLVPVTCPNYFFETIAWLGIWAANRSLSTAVFLVFAFYQMAVWARKKEKRYRAEFGHKYPRNRLPQPARARILARWYSSTAEVPKQEEGREDQSSSTDAEKEDPAKKQMEAKDREIIDLKDKYLRSVAEFRTLQDRSRREQQAARDFALQKFAKDLIESIDNLDLALANVPADKVAKPASDDANADDRYKELRELHGGLQMTSSVLLNTLRRHGIERFDPSENGDTFDPNLHEATFQAPQPGKEDGTVFHTVQKGFMLNGRVLRAPKVGVVKNA
ncbi:MAG: hypothetical protein Q9162_004244 [Coniocarpon cinnabarinum]